MQTVNECCAPLLDEPLDPEAATSLAEWYSVLADPTRLRLLSLISASGEACAACDLVESEKNGKWIYYRPVPERLGILSRALAG